MEEIEWKKEYNLLRIDDYLQNANNESDCCKKEGWINLVARWEQYLKEISGIEYRKEECGISGI